MNKINKILADDIENCVEGEHISLNDSTQAYLKGLRVMGKTEQFTTNGYQLFDASRIGSTESAGVKFTNNGDGSFTITKADTNDTDVTTSSFQVAYSYTHEETVAMFKAGKVYIKGDATISPPLSIQERWTVDGTIKSTSVAFINGTKYITITEDELNDPTYHIRFVFYISASTTITAGTIKPIAYQLKNDTDKFDGTWEPYTGGKPAPNVDYPQPLEDICKPISGCQLFDANKVSMKDNTIINGNIKVVRNNDGSFTFSSDGEKPTTPFGLTHKLTHEETVALFRSGKISVSGPPITVSNPYIYCQLTKTGATSSEKIEASTSGGKNLSKRMVEFPEEFLNNPDYYVTMGMYISTNSPITDGTYKPMVYQDGDGTWEPYNGGVKTLGTKIKINSRNLFNPSEYITAGNYYSKNVNLLLTNNYGTIINSYTYDDNKITITQGSYQETSNPTSYKNGYFMIGLYNSPIKFNKTYTLVADINITKTQSGASKQIAIVQPGGGNLNTTIKNHKLYYTFLYKPNTSSPDGKYLDIRCCGNSFELSNIMIVEGNIGTSEIEYEPYQEQVFAVKAPNELPGVPVSSDGNYIDKNGQEWVCDEFNCEKKEYIQRIAEWKYTGGELPSMSTCQVRPSGDILYFNFNIKGVSGKVSGNANVLCNAFRCGNVLYEQGVTYIANNTNNHIYFSIKASDVGVAYEDGKTSSELKEIVKDWMQKTFSEENPLITRYPLLEPIKIPMLESEVDAYQKLQTNYPRTTIHNDIDTHMVVDYVADTKNYIDNKIASEVAKLSAAIITE